MLTMLIVEDNERLQAALKSGVAMSKGSVWFMAVNGRWHPVRAMV